MNKPIKNEVIFELSGVDLDEVTWPQGYHSCPFSYGPIGAFKCHLLRWKYKQGGSYEVKCPSEIHQRRLDPQGPQSHKLPAIPECPLRRGPITVHVRFYLECNLCGRLEAIPFAEGDECVCGGTFISFENK